MANLEIQNMNFLLDKLLENSKTLMNGNADVIFDNIHDPIQFWFILGQAKFACQLNKMGKLSDGATKAVLDQFSTSYKATIELLLRNVGDSDE
ncbi:Uncharacterised protein [Acinetobacter phage MD-2021a]|nr:Uncharacterised protein [Acinetobacter phage MD-2021a]